MTVNRVCGSGAQAIVSAAHRILMGSVDAAIADGMESMDAAPYLVARGRWGHRLGTGLSTTACCETASTMPSRMCFGAESRP